MIVALIFILLSLISFIALIGDAVKHSDCPASPQVPVWLIVSGAVGIFYC